MVKSAKHQIPSTSLRAGLNNIEAQNINGQNSLELCLDLIGIEIWILIFEFVEGQDLSPIPSMILSALAGESQPRPFNEA